MQEELAQFVQELEMQAPCQVSGQTNENSHVYATLVQAALSPGRYTPQTPSRKVSVWHYHVSLHKGMLACLQTFAK